MNKDRAEMITDVMKSLLIADDISLKHLYQRFFVVRDVEIEKPGTFYVTQDLAAGFKRN